MPLVSIIIPVYNVEKFLGFCLDSVMAQTFTDFEALCVNDGSTDGSAQILENKAKMLEAFADELRDLDKAGLLKFRYHKFLRWLAYRRLVKKGK